MISVAVQDKGSTATTLGDVVRAQSEQTGKSYRAIARDAGVSINTVHKIVHGKLTHVPGARVLDGLAHAIGVDVAVLRDAAAHNIGVREFVVEDSTRRAVYLAMGDLSADDQHMLLQLAESLRSRTRARDNDDA